MKKIGKNFSSQNLTDSNIFCMAPWTHLHFMPSGDTFPCCAVNTANNSPIGNLKNNSIDEIWNSKDLKKLRLSMLNGQKSDFCNICYSTEKCGGVSLRNYINERFSHHIKNCNLTEKDGNLDEVNLPYIDLRLSNSCNFRCRICTPAYSTALQNDFKFIHKNYPDIGLNRLFKSFEQMIDTIGTHLETCEEIYLAGGEPLINKDNYRLLEWLIDKDKTDVRLVYSTNFSTFISGKDNILKLWRKFKNIHLRMSIDGYEGKGEFLRKGQVWSEFLENASEVKNTNPHVRLIAFPTLSIFNALHLPELHAYLFKKRIIKFSDFHINLLEEPPVFSATVLPKRIKLELREIYLNYIFDYHKNPSLHPKHKKNLSKNFRSCLNYIFSRDDSKLLRGFKERVMLFDKAQGTDFKATFPELSKLVQ